MTCILCGGEMRPWLKMPIDAKKLTPTPYGDAVKCAACGFGAVEPTPDPSEVPEFYKLDAYYTHGESHFSKGDAVTWLDRLRNKIAYAADKTVRVTPPFVKTQIDRPLDQCSMLDIGCGGGGILLQFQAAGVKAAGLDPDPEAVNALRERGVEAHLGPAEAPPDTLDGRQYDIVLMSHSLEHCVDPLAALKAARMLVAPGGIFICETPNSACAHFLEFTVISEMYDAPRHLYFFTPDNLKTALEQAGFAIQHRYHKGFARHFEGNWRATENRIRDALLTHAPDFAAPREHTRERSVSLMMKSLFASDDEKYDCIGFVAKTA